LKALAEYIKTDKIQKNKSTLFSKPNDNNKSFFFQPKLTINHPNDPYEQEADDMAEKVMRMPIPTTDRPFFFPKSVSVSGLQRKCAECEEEEKNLQRKEKGSGETHASNELESYIGNINSIGTPLPNNVRSFFEPRFGYDFSKVKVHTDSAAAESAQSVNALAYTSGNNIVFNKNQYSPETNNGKKLLAHELTHVVQQKGQKQSIQRQEFTSSITFRQRLFSRWFHLSSGSSLTALIDARRNPKSCKIPAYFNVYLYNVAKKDYETSVKYPIDNRSQYTWKGLAGGNYQFILKFIEKIPSGCNVTGTLEVKQKPAINDIMTTARHYVGSKNWAVNADRPPYGPGTNKCNLFVYEVLNEAGASVQMIERHKWGISRGKHPPLAGQWADRNFSISGWTIVPSPQIGDVVAEAHHYSDASGHVGIVSSVSPDGKSGTTISAATSGSVVENDWGFRSGQSPVFRRYTGR
jgi:hypothetical protein